MSVATFTVKESLQLVVVHVHDVGNLTYTGLLTDLTPHNLHLKVMGLLDQGLEVEAELVIHHGPGS